MKLSQKKIIQNIVRLLLLLLLVFSIFLAVQTFPPVLFRASATRTKSGTEVQLYGIALSGSNVPVQVLVNDIVVPQKEIIKQEYFSIVFLVREEIGASFVYVKKGANQSRAKLLVIARANEFFNSMKQNEGQLDIEHLPQLKTGIPIDDAGPMLVHPLETIYFASSAASVVKNTCTSMLRSNLETVLLPAHQWQLRNDSEFSISLNEQFWFNYSTLSNIALEFSCPNEKNFIFPLELNSILVETRDLSSRFDASIEYKSGAAGASYMLPIQSRSQKRTVLGFEKNHEFSQYNYVRSYRNHSIIDARIAIVPLTITDTSALRFVKHLPHISMVPYLELSSKERFAVEQLSSEGFEVFSALMRTYPAETELTLDDMQYIYAMLKDTLAVVEEEKMRNFFSQLQTSLVYTRTNYTMLYLISKLLINHGFLARTVTGAEITQKLTQDKVALMDPVNFNTDLLVWVELFSPDYGWVPVEDSYENSVAASFQVVAESANEGSAVKELALPRNIIRLYILEELLWLEAKHQRPRLPVRILFPG